MADITITIDPPNTNSITLTQGLVAHNTTHAPSGSDSLATWYATHQDVLDVSGQITFPSNVVFTTGDQGISGVKNFSSRPTVNGTGVLLSGEASAPNTGYLTGYVSKAETGSFLASSQTGALTGSFYPLNSNPSGYVVGAVVRPSNTGNFVDTTSTQVISGNKSFSGLVLIENGFLGQNLVTGNSLYQTSAGGYSNTVNGEGATICGGVLNVAKGAFVSVLGGLSNTINNTSQYSTIVGGRNNTITGYGDLNFIVGTNNVISGRSSPIPASLGNNLTLGSTNEILRSDYSFTIGRSNIISGGNYSFAIGKSANVTHRFAGIISDGTSVNSSGDNTLVINFSNGIHLNGSTFFDNRPTYNGTGFLLSGEAGGTSTTGISIIGASTKTINLYQSDGSVISGSFIDLQGTGDAGDDLYIYSGSFNTADGNLTLNRTGDAGTVVISLDGRYATGSVVRPSETGSFVTNSQTGSFITSSQTGVFYPTSNPSGYITSSALSPYSTIVSTTGISGYLQTQVTNINNQTGNFALKSQTGAFLTTGSADTRYALQSATGAYTGEFYPRSSNPSNYLVAADLSTYATQAYVTGTSGYLQGQITTLNSQTGNYATGSVVRPSETGNFVTTSQTGQFYATSNPQGFITSSSLTPYATTGYVTGVSGYLEGLISASSAGVGTLNGLSGSLTIAGAGNNSVSVAGSTITVSGNTDFLTGYQAVGNYVTTAQTGAFYPITNPSGYITGVDLSSYATTSLVSNVSGHLQGQVTALQSATGNLNTRLSTVEGVTGSFVTGEVVRQSETGSFLTTGAADLRYSTNIRVSEVYIDAGAMLTGVSGATPATVAVSTSGIYYDTYQFDAGTTGFAQFKVKLADYNLGTMRAKFDWTTSGASGGVVWGIQGLAVGNGESLASAWSTGVEVTDSFITGTGHHTSDAISFTPTGTLQSGDMLYLRVYRSVANASDTLAVNASLLGVSLQYTGNSITAW